MKVNYPRGAAKVNIKTLSTQVITVFNFLKTRRFGRSLGKQKTACLAPLSVCLSFDSSLSLCLSILLAICLSVCCMSICLFVCVCFSALCLSIHLSVRTSTLPVDRSIHSSLSIPLLSLFLSTRLSVCMSIYSLVCLHVYRILSLPICLSIPLFTILFIFFSPFSKVLKAFNYAP